MRESHMNSFHVNFFFFQRQDFALEYVFWVDMLQLEMPSFCDGIPKNYC